MKFFTDMEEVIDLMLTDEWFSDKVIIELMDGMEQFWDHLYDLIPNSRCLSRHCTTMRSALRPLSLLFSPIHTLHATTLLSSPRRLVCSGTSSRSCSRRTSGWCTSMLRKC